MLSPLSSVKALLVTGDSCGWAYGTNRSLICQVNASPSGTPDILLSTFSGSGSAAVPLRLSLNNRAYPDAHLYGACNTRVVPTAGVLCFSVSHRSID